MNRKIFTRDIATRTVLFLTTVCFLSGRAKAQTVNGTFHGTVSDSSGAILPGATVEVKNASTDLVRQTTTTGEASTLSPNFHQDITLSMPPRADSPRPGRQTSNCSSTRMPR